MPNVFLFIFNFEKHAYRSELFLFLSVFFETQRMLNIFESDNVEYLFSLKTGWNIFVYLFFLYSKIFFFVMTTYQDTSRFLRAGFIRTAEFRHDQRRKSIHQWAPEDDESAGPGGHVYSLWTHH